MASAPAPAPPPARLWTAGTREVPVFMYHDVVAAPTVWFDLSTAEFRRQMHRLRDAGATVVPLADVLAHLRDGRALPPKAVALTFDQGTLGLYTDAWPILKELGYPSTWFVHTGYVGRPSPTKEHVTWAQLRELAGSGLVDVQPLSVTFPEFLGQLDDAALTREIVDSQAAVERELGRPARYFAYPYGNGDERVARALAAAGCEAAFNEVRAPCAAPADRLFLPRYNPKRLDEALDRLADPRPAPALVGPLDLSPGAPAAAGDVAWQSGEWPAAAPDDAGHVHLGEATLPAHHVLLAAGRFQPLADAAELAAQGRPLVVGNQRQVVLAPYRRWMSAKGHVHSACDSLSVLLEPANWAVLGDRWLVRDGQPLAGGEAAAGRPALVGVSPTGQLAWGRPTRDLSHAELLAALAGWRQVVVLGD